MRAFRSIRDRILRPVDGFSLPEVMVSMTVVTMLVIGTTSVMGTSADVTLKAQRRDEAAAVGFALLEYVESSGCGLITGNLADQIDLKDGGGWTYSERLQKVKERCFGGLGYNPSIVYDPLNPAFSTVPELCDGSEYTCSFDIYFDWPRTPSTTFSNANGVCPALYDNGVSVTARNTQPTVLVRTITVSYTHDGETYNREFSTRESVNPDAPAFQRFGSSTGYWRVDGPPGTEMTYTTNPLSPSDSAHRQSITFRIPAGHGCIVFPFLSESESNAGMPAGATYFSVVG